MKKIFTLLLLSSAWLSKAQTNFTPRDWGTSLTGYWNFDNFVEAQIGSNLVSQVEFTHVAALSATDFAVRKTVPIFLVENRNLKAHI